MARYRDKAKQAVWMRAWRAKNKEHIKQYDQNYKPRAKELRDKRKRDDPYKYVTLVLKSKREWRAANPERRKAYYQRYRIWSAENRDRINAGARRRSKAKREADPAQRIKDSIYCRVSMAIRAMKVGKQSSTKKLLGCDIQFLMGYLEARFLPGMTWENYGRFGWHVDHHIPCAEFDLTDPDQQRQCFHYTNLRPMWRADNIRKGKMKPPIHQAELI